ncbi:deoxyribose-phosphate aldolase [Allofrancisella guangzhouensis]|uniref:Deoxyribose-phosphate aldolase n=1 Tax=Allofrancisella guangzhouensis TaxID=594679 RepID=A0A0A8E2P8_9GAMM|nr:deoxyribose-phosphate aldolase [Allofrancisella guangzhouensis]AJC48224.1 deoxyribose-phosphate aldolase [Allofrancisella guangzhouensis]MBK2027156.1 deoxyribose-phosphate aldolase [Allofrancisella guangzhouensis]MBK2044580.1 deoxyribose-phosphate aldolase [Allofrancisella guangzhouensis]MBK2046002.1 deoxyribose-phosphate aldolase [Allofrancisella guangzhouensis]
MVINKQKIVSLIDLTQLGEDDTEQQIINLCLKAKNSFGTVAAICIYKQFIPLVKKQLGKDFRVATVVNFPQGSFPIEEVLAETKEALALGADEIDLVIDYKEYLEKGFSDKSCKMISKVKELCANKILKVIIESGELKPDQLIHTVSQDAINNGADFIKTSTGKTPQGATLQAAKIILQTIKKSKRTVGFKASGGIRNYEQAVEYINLAQELFSEDYIYSKTFRFGVSSLLDNLLTNDGYIKDAY